MKYKRSFLNYFCIFAGALALFFATPPFNLFPLSYIAFFILMLSIKDREKPFLKGFYFGFIYNLSTMYWIAYVLSTYGNIPLLISVFLLILLISYLSLYPAVFTKLLNYAEGRISDFYLPFYAAFVWLILEVVRAKFMTGFPWMLLAYTQHNFLPLIQSTKHLTVYGIGFIIIFVNTAFYVFYRKRDVKRFIPLAGALLVLIFLIVSGNSKIERLKTEYSRAKKISVRCVQGNIDQSQKWEKRLQYEIINKYMALTGNTAAELVIWPETALPFVFGSDAGLTQYFKNIMADKTYWLVTGFVGFDYDEDGKAGLTNSAGLFYKGDISGRYNKIHLVPFGEYVPLKKLLFFVNKLVEAAGDFLSGRETEVLTFKDIKMGTLICYEAIFPEISHKYKKKGANILINITNDAWFGRSSAPYQHLAMSRFRAVENEMYLIRVANTGITAVITPWGEIINHTALFEDATINEIVYYK